MRPAAPAGFAALVTAAAVLAASACTPTKEDPAVNSPTSPSSAAGSGTASLRTQSESMAALRSQLDPIIAAVGPVKEVKRDQVVPCDPSNDRAGYAATYTVWVTPQSGAQDRVSGSIIPGLQSQGWRVERSPRTDVVDWSFHKAPFDIGVTFNLSTGITAIGGSGPCLPDKV